MVELDNLELRDLLELGLTCSLPTTVDLLAEHSVKHAWVIRPAVSATWTGSPVCVYWNPATEKVGFARGSAADRDLCRNAVEPLGYDLSPDVDLRDDWWVKVSESPTIRTIGESLQFLPSKWMPGAGGRPVASTIAAGLLGAGLGYGGGWLAERFIPQKYREKGRLPAVSALAGGLAGAGVGSLPGFANLLAGKSFNDPSILTYGKQAQAADELGILYSSACKYASAAMFEGIDGELLKEAFGTLSPSDSPMIRMDELGRVVWGGQSTASTTAMTAATMYGASQMPDPRALPGMVTPHQTGLLSMAVGAAGGGLKGYLAGYGAGKTLAALTGLPEETQNTIALTGLGLGIAKAIIPKILGLEP